MHKQNVLPFPAVLLPTTHPLALCLSAVCEYFVQPTSCRPFASNRLEGLVSAARRIARPQSRSSITPKTTLAAIHADAAIKTKNLRLSVNRFWVVLGVFIAPSRFLFSLLPRPSATPAGTPRTPRRLFPPAPSGTASSTNHATAAA